MKYCRVCVLPDSRPGVILDTTGVCLACKNANLKESEIDWSARKEAFLNVVRNAQSAGSEYDCIIPVSGGKDSTWQVVTCLEYGLRPLAVTWRAPARSPLGTANLDNLVALGVDHIDYQINPQVEKRFMLETFRKRGSPAIPMHLAMFGIPLKIASKFKIPLVVWGENSAFEYGSADQSLTGFKLDHAWLKRFGVTQGTTVDDWISKDLPARALSAYRGPTEEELVASNVLAVFLGYYFRWDPLESLRVAQTHGFKVREEGPKTGFWNYADIDDDFISLHHYVKWFKFGCTRLFDNLSVEIRNGRVTRDQAIDIIREYREQRPEEDIRKFCEFCEISVQEFDTILESFRNQSIWKKIDGVWTMPGFLIADWKW